jgi:hypothetical protein
MITIFNKSRTGPKAAVLAAALAAFLETAGGAAQTIREPVDPGIGALSNAQIVRNFGVVAFGNEYVAQQKTTIRKWVVPIKVALITGGPEWNKMPADYPDYVDEFIARQIADLAAVSKHPIEFYFSPKRAKKSPPPKGFDINQANMYLYYLPANRLPEAMAPFFPGGVREVERLMYDVEAIERKKKLKPGEKSDLRGSTCFANLRTKGSEIRLAAVGFPAEHPKDIIRACVIEELTQVLGLPNDSESVNPSIFNDRSP